MVGHYLGSEDFTFRIHFNHRFLQVDMSLANWCPFYVCFYATMTKNTKQWITVFGNHCNVNNARLSPRSGFLPFKGFCGHTYLIWADGIRL
jgi:hypothetical protein